MKLKPLALSVASLLFCSALPAAASSTFKQLAGPASEIAQMRAPSPAEAAIHSKSALIPVELSAGKSGHLSWRMALPVERPDLQILLLAGEDHGWELGIRGPSGTLYKAAQLAERAEPGEFGLEGERFASELYRFGRLQKGDWSLEITATAGARTQGFLLIEGDASTELASHPTHLDYLAGGRIGLTAQLTAIGKAGVALGPEAGSVDEAAIRLTRADGSIEKIAMFDDGRHADGAAGDGLYGGVFDAGSAGPLNAQVIVKGRSADGTALIRTAEHLIPVVESDLHIGDVAHASLAKSGGPSRLALRVPVSTAKKGGHYRAIGEVWGRDAKGADIAIAWVGGMVEITESGIELGFDERWVAKAGARGPFELRHLRIEDPNHFVSLAKAERLPLAMTLSAQKYAAVDLQIDELMTQGPRPAGLNRKGVGSRLILVHGYCSGGVWPASQFSNASTFLDANQNRSHDEFARRIRDFGATWNSFGTVAHSQGGAASLHLYTYYWSGLDNAVGARRMQSVGTPYQGTNLAGVLAALGGIFGVGCGSNSNLTYSGAASWLAGIPSWARGQVHYYSTGFRSTNWWTNDFCNFASDLVLSDPEDGTVERSSAQLPGAVNQGHVSGQCHTAGMRDPAQYLDASRNSVMNANAAR
jgi:hypothetical protein